MASLIRRIYRAALTVEQAQGVLAGQLNGCVAAVELVLTGTPAVFAAFSGPVTVAGRLTGLSGSTGASLLGQLLKAAGKTDIGFSGDWQLAGAATHQVLNVPGRASFAIRIETRATTRELAISGTASITDRVYAMLLSSASFIGPAIADPTDAVIDAPPSGGDGGTSGWRPRAADGLVRGFMATDLLADTGLTGRTAELMMLRSAFTDLLVTADLQVPKDGQTGNSWMRPYVGHCRTRDDLTDLARTNIAFLRSLGFRLHLVLFNSWAIKNGYSENLGSTGGRRAVSEVALYADQAPFERAFIRRLVAAVGSELYAIMPCLEAASATSGSFCVEMLKELRAAGYTGVLSANLIGDARASSSAAAAQGALLAPSINGSADWFKSSADIRNSDGMMELTQDNAALVGRFVAAPGPRGYYIWAKGAAGSNQGRGRLSDAFCVAAGASKSSGGGGTTQPPPANETPKQRCARLYPGVGYGDGNEGKPGDNTTLWKPKSDSTGRLVLVCGHNLGRVQYARVMRGDKELGRISHKRNIGNGWRLNLDGPANGASYGTGLRVVIVTDDGEVGFNVPKGAERASAVLSPPRPAAPPTPLPPDVPVPNPDAGYSPIRGLPGWSQNLATGSIRAPALVAQSVIGNPVYFYDDADRDARPNLPALALVSVSEYQEHEVSVSGYEDPDGPLLALPVDDYSGACASYDPGVPGADASVVGVFQASASAAYSEWAIGHDLRTLPQPADVSARNGWLFLLGQPYTGPITAQGMLVIRDDYLVTTTVPPVAPPVPPVTPPTPPVPPPPPPSDPTGGALFHTSPTTLTLRADFFACVRPNGIDVLVNIVDPAGPGRPPVGSSTAVRAVQNGMTWTIPKPITDYPKGNVPNTWRIRIKPGMTYPKGMTYHTSINQSFIRAGDNAYGPGNVTYPKTIRP